MNITQLLANLRAKIPFQETTTPANQKLAAVELVALGNGLGTLFEVPANFLPGFPGGTALDLVSFVYATIGSGTVTPSNFPAQIIGEGDSIVKGSVAISWLVPLAAALSSDYVGYLNEGEGGERSDQTLAQIQTQVIANKSTTAAQTIAILGIGTNDERSPRTVQEIVGDILEWGTLARLAGIKPIYDTMGPDRRRAFDLTAVGGDVQDLVEDERMHQLWLTCIAEIKANYLAYGFMGLVDNSTDPLIGQWDTPITQYNQNYKDDYIHPSNQGQTYKAVQKIKPVVEAVAALPLGTFVAPAPYVYTAPGTVSTPITPTNLEHVTVNGTTVTKTSGTTDNFDGGFTSVEAAGASTAAVKAKMDWASSAADGGSVTGFSVQNNTSTSFTDPVVAWQREASQGARVFGSMVPGGPGAWTPLADGKRLHIHLLTNQSNSALTDVVWLFDEAVQRTEMGLNLPYPLRVDSSMLTLGGTIRDMRLFAANPTT